MRRPNILLITCDQHHVHSAQCYVEDGGSEFVPDGWSVAFDITHLVRPGEINVIALADKDKP